MADNTAATRRAERLAAALRANLQRRKGRDRETPTPEANPGVNLELPEPPLPQP